jgi:hypothetical protein
MKDFFTQCMKDLYALTGIEQVRWMQNDMVSGKRDFDLCVDAMVETCKQFPYIPEVNQKEIIRKMMVSDKDYKSLNSRTIYAWLSLHKDVHYRGQTHYQEPEAGEIAPPEVAEKYIQQFKDNLMKIGTTEGKAGIKDGQIQRMKDQLEPLQCKHPFMFNGLCLDCGEGLTDDEKANAKDVTPKQKVLSQGTSQFSEDMLTPVTPSTGAETKINEQG